MFISKAGLDLIKKFEGCILYSYDDETGRRVNQGGQCLGTLTIGYGHTQSVYRGQTITMTEAENLLKNDMIYYCNDVQSLIDNKTIIFAVNQNMFDALVSFDYNLGKGNLIRLCRNRNIDEVLAHITEYVSPGTIWEEGLRKRRNAEKELFMKPPEIPKLTRVLKYRCSGEDVKALQNKLIEKGYSVGRFGVDGIFGNATLDAVVRYQKDKALGVDGEVFNQTWSSLFS